MGHRWDVGNSVVAGMDLPDLVVLCTICVLVLGCTKFDGAASALQLHELLVELPATLLGVLYRTRELETELLLHLPEYGVGANEDVQPDVLAWVAFDAADLELPE